MAKVSKSRDFWTHKPQDEQNNEEKIETEGMKGSFSILF